MSFYGKELIGMWGGCFNPPTKGHFLLGCEMGRSKFFKSLEVTPAYNHVDKINEINPWYRFGMTYLMVLALQAQAKLERWETEIVMSSREFMRGGKSRTILTLKEIEKEAKDQGTSAAFTGGMDVMQRMVTWADGPEIQRRFLSIGFPREGVDLSEGIDGVYMADTKLIRKKSSSVIRTEIEQGMDVSDDLLPVIYGYIKRHSLYGYRSMKKREFEIISG